MKYPIARPSKQDQTRYPLGDEPKRGREMEDATMTQIHDIRKAFFEEGRDISEISRLFKRIEKQSADTQLRISTRSIAETKSNTSQTRSIQTRD